MTLGFVMPEAQRLQLLLCVSLQMGSELGFGPTLKDGSDFASINEEGIRD